MHTSNNIWKEGNHVVVAHGHIGDNLLESNLLVVVHLVLFGGATLEFLSQFGNFALLDTRIQ